MITIKLGCKGEAVKTLQTALNKYGYNLKVDGAFGTKTEAAVKDYQKKYGLSVDGIVGAKTWSKLGYSTSEVSMPRLINEIILHCSATKEGVNFTSGLGYVRTSPDHGTAYDIAGSMKADPTSMREAIYRAIDIYRNRERYDEAAANPLRIAPPKS